MAKFTDDYLHYLLAQASASVSASFHAALAKQGVAVSTWRILASLYPYENMTVSELAASCMTKQPTMTRMIDRLSADNLVVRKPAATDRRRVHVSLTEHGREMAKELVEVAKRDETTALAAYTNAEQSALKDALRALQRNAEQKR
jgi:DNA-binding MarR family transcriptional regulator